MRLTKQWMLAGAGAAILGLSAAPAFAQGPSGAFGELSRLAGVEAPAVPDVKARSIMAEPPSAAPRPGRKEWPFALAQSLYAEVLPLYGKSHPVPVAQLAGGWKLVGYVSDAPRPECRGGMFDPDGLEQPGPSFNAHHIEWPVQIALRTACGGTMWFSVEPGESTPFFGKWERPGLHVHLGCYALDDDAVICRAQETPGAVHYFALGRKSP